MMEKYVWLAGKVLGTFTLIGTLCFLLFRVVLNYLLGSHTDIGLYATPVVFVVGIVFILYITVKCLKNIDKTMKEINTLELNQIDENKGE